MGVWCPGVVSVPGISLGYCSTGLEVSVEGSEILRSPFEVGRKFIPFFYRFFFPSKRWLALGFLNHPTVAPPRSDPCR